MEDALKNLDRLKDAGTISETELASLRLLHRYRATEQQMAEERKHLTAQSDHSLKELYASLVKSGALTAEDAMVIPYLLWGSQDERRFMGALMLRKTGHERVRSHNFHVAATKEASFLPAIRLLTEGEAEITGGEPTTAFYRHRQPRDLIGPPTHTTVRGGEYLAPIIQRGNEQLVDLTSMEQFLLSTRGQPRTRYNKRGRGGYGWRGGRGLPPPYTQGQSWPPRNDDRNQSQQNYGQPQQNPSNPMTAPTRSF